MVNNEHYKFDDEMGKIKGKETFSPSMLNLHQNGHLHK